MTDERRRRRTLTDDERKLWKTVSKQWAPLSFHDEDEDGEDGAVPAAVAAKPARPSARAEAPKSASKPKPSSRVLSEFEPRRAKRLASGRIEIEAKIDLHGMRQSEAREALMRFLQSAQVRGLKHVKVITGKGASVREEEPRPFDMFEDRRGVLRDEVPRWLSMGDARPLVVSFTEAGRGHGGSGALYVQVRKRG